MKNKNDEEDTITIEQFSRELGLELGIPAEAIAEELLLDILNGELHPIVERDGVKLTFCSPSGTLH